MTEHIHKCSKCNSYTMEKICSKCKQETILPKPPKFSLEDKYGEYRRKVKKEELEKKGLA